MSITPIGGTSPDWASVAGVGRPSEGPRQQAVLSSVGQLVGMSADDLKSALASGKSLAAIASDKGIPHDDLVGAIKAGLLSAATNGAAPANLDEMANRIAGRVPHGHHGHHGHHHHGGGAAAVTPAASDPSSSATGAGSPSGQTVDQRL